MFEKYRIIEIDNKFIPQIKKNLFSFWKGIDKDECETWNALHNQLEFCSYENINLAKIRIEKYKNEKKIIYHSV